MNKAHVMTGEDRRVLSILMEKIEAIHSIRDHAKYIYFVQKAMEEAKKRNAVSYYGRFKTMLMAARLSKRAFETRLSSRGITTSVAMAISL